jgi:hypothetical protein
MTLFAAFILINSCSKDDNPVDITDAKVYFPLTIGSWWVYENYELDENGDRILDTREEDSSIVSGIKTILEKEAKVVTSYDEDGSSEDNYFYTDYSWLYAHSSFFKLPIEEIWILIADLKGNNWDIAEYDIPEIEYETSIGKGVLNGKLNIKGEKGGTKTITVDNKKIKCREFKIIVNFTGTFKKVNYVTPAYYTIIQHSWYGENVGLVQEIVDPYVFKIPTVGSTNHGGYESILLKYNIVQ